jgi:DNA-binding LytR/AlgR family response regulator
MKTYIQKGNNTLLILNHKSSQKVLINTVVFLEGNINYTIVHLESGKQKVVARSLKFFEAFLETHGFVRTHRSYMINPIHIKSLNHEQYKVVMNTGQEAMISRRKKNLFKTFS